MTVIQNRGVSAIEAQTDAFLYFLPTSIGLVPIPLKCCGLKPVAQARRPINIHETVLGRGMSEMHLRPLQSSVHLLQKYIKVFSFFVTFFVSQKSVLVSNLANVMNMWSQQFMICSKRSDTATTCRKI